MNTATTRQEATQYLQTYGRVIYCGCEIWETIEQQPGREAYTGKYRFAPVGQRYEWENWMQDAGIKGYEPSVYLSLALTGAEKLQSLGRV